MDLEFPEIIDFADQVVDAAPAAIDPPAATTLAVFRSTALAELTAVDKGIAALRNEHGSTAYDITTPHGYKLATARRHAVRLVRYRVPKVVKDRKAELKDIVSALDTEAERITEALLAIENPHDEAIKAEDARREAIAAEKKRLNDERVSKHQAGIERIRGYLTACQAPGMTAERIGKGIAKLEPVEFPSSEWEEFAVQAANTQCEVLEAMRTLQRQAQSREDEAERQEAIRAENERVAAELSAERARIAAEAEAVRKASAELAAAQAAQAKVTADKLAEEERAADAKEAERQADEIARLEPIEKVDPDLELGADPVSVMPAAPSVSAEEKTAVLTYLQTESNRDMHSLGSLNDEIGIVMNEYFITNVLDFSPAARRGRSVLYTPMQRTNIIRALIRRLEGLL
jgi:hypothetical protein